MQNMKKRLAVLASTALVAVTLLNPFVISASALDSNKQQISATVSQALQQGSTAQPSAEPTAQPSAEPTAQPSAEPTAQPSAEPTAQPSAEPTAQPSAEPTAQPSAEPTAQPSAEPTAQPSAVPTASSEQTAAPQESDTRIAMLDEQDLKSKIESILEKGSSISQMKEEDLENALQEIEQIQKAPLAISAENQDQEMDELLDELDNVQIAMEDMRMAYQAQREGWLNQLPQTGKENSWRYQNGERITQNQQPEDLSLDLPDGVSTFSANGYWGIDVSHHQGVIDWNAVKAAGIDFAIIRCGYGMDLESQDDSQWARNASECERLGIPYGVYFYSYATDTNMAAEEARHALRLLNGYYPDLPVFYDLEENRQLVVGNSGLAAMAKVFCDTLSSRGYKVGIYASLNWWQYYLTDSVFENWYRWVAEWRSSCSYNGRYEMWQYTDRGTINGITKLVDMNYWYEPLNSKTPKEPISVATGTYTIATSMDYSKVLDVYNNSLDNGANVDLFTSNGGANQQFKIVPCGDGYYNIVNVNSGKVLDVDGWGSGNVLQWDATGGENQKWYFEDAGNGLYYIRSKSTRLYLDVSGGQATSGANIQVYRGTDGANQKFKLDRVADKSVKNGVYNIATALDTNKVLDLPNGSSVNGANIQLFTANGGLNQQFELVLGWDGYYTIRNTQSGKVLDVDGWGSGNVLQWDATGGDNQKWILEDAGNGYYYIRSKSSGLYLDVWNNQSSDGTKLNVFSFNGGNNQKFKISRAASSSVQNGVYNVATSLNTNKVLDVPNGSFVNGTNIQLFTTNGGVNQQFELILGWDGYYTIRNTQSGKVLDVDGWGSGNVLQWDATGGDNQKWILENAGNGYYYIRSKGSDMYLDVWNNQSSDGTKLDVFTFNGGSNQKFLLKRVSGTTEVKGTYFVSSKLDSNKVVELEGFTNQNGANIELFTKNGGDNQKFELIANSDGTYLFKNVYSKKVMDVDGWGSGNVLQWDATGGDNQKWVLEPAGDGYYYIRSKNTGLYLDVFNNQTSNKTNIDVFTFNGGNNQKFKLVQ